MCSCNNLMFLALSSFFAALVIFVIVLPACCTAGYHWYSYKKGWDDDISQCESNCSGCFHESLEEAHFRRREKWRYMCRLLKADAIKQAAAAAGSGEQQPPPEANNAATAPNNSNHI